MFEEAVLKRLPADLAEALAAHYEQLAHQLRQRAAHARDAARDRQRLAGLRADYERAAVTVEQLVQAGADRADAVATLAARLLRSPAELEALLQQRERHRASAAKVERHLAIARALKDGRSHREIGQTLQLHQKSVARIARHLKTQRMVDAMTHRPDDSAARIPGLERPDSGPDLLPSERNALLGALAAVVVVALALLAWLLL